MSRFYLVIIWFFLLSSLYAVFYNKWFSDEELACEYTDEIQSCYWENFSENWVTGSPESIEDFVCLQSTNKEEIVYQVILDKEFTKVDEKIENYLSNLETDKSKYFWSTRESNFLSWVQEIYDDLWKNWKYYQMYRDKCSLSKEDQSILLKTVSCLGWDTSINYSRNSFVDSTCMSFAEAKLNVYKDVAVDILKYNKKIVREDDRKTYEKKQRTKYDEVLDLFRINLWYVERIWKKWPSKTKSPY